MSEVFINCPKCKTLLLGDAVQCPSCEFIIDPQRANELGVSHGSSELPHHTEQVACRKCGEMNLVGLVRCWSCGTFLREDIERLFQSMLRSRERIEFTPLPEISSSDMSHPKAAAPAAPPPATLPEPPPVDEPGGFELDESMAGFVEDDAPATAAASQAASPSGDAAGETYRLKNAEQQKADTADRAGSPAGPAAGPAAGSHSEETGGDALLEIALQEEKQAAKAKAARKQKLAMRQKAGRRPAAGSAAKVPSKTPPNGMKRPEAAKEATKPQAGRTAADQWLTDVRLHEVVPAKVKLKPGSLAAQSREADVGATADQLVVAALVKPVGFFSLTRGGGGNKDEVRQALRERLAKDAKNARNAVQQAPSQQAPSQQAPSQQAPSDDKPDEKAEEKKPEAKSEPLPGAAHRVLSREQVARIKVVQPVAYLHESMFAGVSVFGEGHIAVLLPPGEAADAKPDPKTAVAWFLSFPLSQFRRFSAMLDRRFGVKGLGLADGIPLDDRMKPVQCHYSEEKFDALPVEELPFYQADPEIELELRGHRCAACGIVVSEESRRKEKIGGLNGKGLAKAKCPKCGGKFGTVPLYRIKPKQAEGKPAETAVEKAAG
jgi:hypothetical protein